ncbi:hypothetical protein [Pseudoalteromonas aurantia]|uniref:hypothetical protein n=1 Tax=Pseudoalteromonas aurantia TaxID=43654 RepID=UPI00110BBFC0|nr:hypothetical protein [Pseudoalteromonas aurantia]
MSHSGTRNQNQNIATNRGVSQWSLEMLGLTVKEAELHYQYQANSIWSRNVLSYQFIGMRLRDPQK